MLVALLMVVARPRGAHAADPKAQSDLESAEQALVNMDYDTANKIADRVSKHRGLSHEQLVRTYRVLALTHAVLDHEAQAREAFQFLLVIDPEYQGDPNLGPKVQAPFMEARGYVRAQAVKAGIETSVSVRANEPGSIRVTTRDPAHIVKKVVVGWRWGSDTTYATSTVPAGEAQVVQVSAPPPGASRLDYYAQATDDRDGALFESGNPNVPKSTTVEAPSFGGGPAGAGAEAPQKSGGSIVSSPIFWVVVGVIVAGGAVTAVALTSKKDNTTKTETQTLPANSVSLFPGLQCGQTKCN